MHILVVTQYFWPEAFIINDLVRKLCDQGAEVTVLTGKPNYPEGEIFPGYERAGLTEEIFDGRIRVLRVPLRPRGRAGAIDLAWNYLSFVASGLIHFPRMVRELEPDVILCFAPSPITSVIPAIMLRRKTRAHLALWVQDLWPESLAATGHVRSSVLLSLAGRMVRMAYARCDTLLVPSRGFIKPVSRYADPSKIVYFPNSVPDSSAAVGDDVEGGALDGLLNTLQQHFCAVFAGNIGRAQAVETLVDAAERMKHVRDFRLVLVGSGSRLAWVREECARRGLDNVVLAGRFPMEMMPTILRRAQVLVVSLRKEKIFSYTIPSKVQAYMAAGRPLLAALDGEGARIVEEAGAGLTCPAEDSAALATRLQALYEMSALRRDEFGTAGRRYFLEHFEMTKLTWRLLNILRERAPRPPASAR
jgi:glycosyltransferase involved in cell wall biosynthesis